VTTYRDTWARLIRLGWPVTATSLVRVSMRTVDLLVIGLVLGAPGVAALGIGDAFARLVMMVGFGLGAGTIATVSQHIGAENREGADRAVTQPESTDVSGRG
jgi:Na+-driven multidrug efflux pump